LSVALNKSLGKAGHPVVSNQCVMNLVIVYGLQENVRGKGSGYFVFLKTNSKIRI